MCKSQSMLTYMYAQSNLAKLQASVISIPFTPAVVPLSGCQNGACSLATEHRRNLHTST
jgi:hypothetical protein